MALQGHFTLPGGEQEEQGEQGEQGREGTTSHGCQRKANNRLSFALKSIIQIDRLQPDRFNIPSKFERTFRKL